MNQKNKLSLLFVILAIIVASTSIGYYFGQALYTAPNVYLDALNTGYVVHPGGTGFGVYKDGQYVYSSDNATQVLYYLFTTSGIHSVRFEAGDYPITYVQNVPSNFYMYSLDGARLYLPTGQANEDAHHQILRIIGVENVTIEGFVFDGCLGSIDSSVGGAAIIIWQGSSHITIQNNYFTKFRNFGIYVIAYGTGGIVSDVKILSNTFYKGGMWNPVAINSDTNGVAKGVIVNSNTITYFDEFGICFTTDSLASIVTDCIASNNYIAYSGNGDYGHDYLDTAQGIKFEGSTNCIASGNTISHLNSGIGFNDHSSRNIAIGNMIITNTTVALSGRNSSNGVWMYGTENMFTNNIINVGWNVNYAIVQNVIWCGGTRCTVSNNLCIMGGTVQSKGIMEGGTGNFIFGNRLYGFAAVDDWYMGGTTPHVHDNLLSNSTWAPET